MIKPLLFLASHELFDTRFYPLYKKFKVNQWLDYNLQKERQEIQLRQLIKYSYERVPYYRKLFDENNISYTSIETIKDLEKIPILTKKKIKNNWDGLKPLGLKNIPHYTFATGGTTGTPVKFRLDKYDRLLGLVLLYVGWSKSGYRLSDKTIFLGGASLDIDQSGFLVQKIHELGRNVRKLSSFDMGPEELQKYSRILNKYEPKFIRGYASAIYFFSRWLEKNKFKWHKPKAIITTSDKLYPKMRIKIEEIFQCKVFDSYGLKDGGVSAFECSTHECYHIDTERSIVECVDNGSNQIINGKGKVLATSLYNYSMPFIRYDTGDLAKVINKKCSCGRDSKLFDEITGRSVDIFITPEGKYVHGWFFLYLFWEYEKGINAYQVIQKSESLIQIKIVPERNFDYSIIAKIEKMIKTKSLNWNVEFEYVEKIISTESGKYKFIVSHIDFI